MRLVYHGGQCCGIKHIYGFPTSGLNESGTAPPIPATTGPQSTTIVDGVNVPTSTGWFVTPIDVPAEPWTDRIDRYLDYHKKNRFGGVIEVVLMDNQWREGNGKTGQMEWESVLLDRGFKEVNKCWNSNSNNIIHIYHLNFLPDDKTMKINYPKCKIVDGQFLPEWKLKQLKKEAEAAVATEE